MGARVYNPYTGAFTQPDPIQGGGATPYGYTDGDPVNEEDLAGTDVTEGEMCAKDGGHYLSDACDMSLVDMIASHPVEDIGALLVVTGTGGLADVALGGAADVAEDAPTIDDASADHIFREEPGHLSEDTPENRALIEGTVKPENYVRTGGGGEDLYRENLEDGTQSWAKVYRGKVTNGGLNKVPLR
jgi:hypothetical protein